MHVEFEIQDDKGIKVPCHRLNEEINQISVIYNNDEPNWNETISILLIGQEENIGKTIKIDDIIRKIYNDYRQFAIEEYQDDGLTFGAVYPREDKILKMWDKKNYQILIKSM